MMSATHYFGDVDVICDIGGQDIKVLFMANGDIKNFRLSNQCSAGNGMLLQAMADQFGVPVTKYADVAFEAKLSPKFSYGCAVFLDSDRVNFQKEGYSKEELLAGLAQVLPKNVWQYVVQIPRMAELGSKFVFQGGTQNNFAALEGAGRLHQAARPERRSLRAPAHAAKPARSAPRWRPAASSCAAASRPSSASITRSIFSTRPRTTKRRAATSARTSARARSSTPRRPTASTSRYISGFCCEKGTVETEDAMIALNKERKQAHEEVPEPGRLRGEAGLSPLLRLGADAARARQTINDIEVKKTLLGDQEEGDSAPVPARSAESWEERRDIRIGIPSVLNIWSLAPFCARTSRRWAFRSRTSCSPITPAEEMWHEGGKYGSIDPCYPSEGVRRRTSTTSCSITTRKRASTASRRRSSTTSSSRASRTCRPARQPVMDTATCPVVAGHPRSCRRRSRRRPTSSPQRGISYLDTAVTFNEPRCARSRCSTSSARARHDRGRE